jgi:hypothetical protein
MIRRDRINWVDAWPHRWFGWWREEHGRRSGYPSIYTFVREKGFAYAEKEKIVEYLSTAYAYAATTWQGCLITGRGPLSTLCYRTDGKWHWPDDLAYYVDKQRVCLPTKMLAEMEKNGFKPPEVGISCVGSLDWPRHKKYMGEHFAARYPAEATTATDRRE